MAVQSEKPEEVLREMGFVDKAKGFVSSPTATFRAVEGDTLGDALKYALIWLVILGVLFGIILSVLFGVIAGMLDMFFTIPGWVHGLGFALIPLMAIFLGIVGILSLLIGGAWQHLWVYVCGGRKGYTQTVKAGAYGATPSFLLGWIPYVGIAGAVWAIVVNILGLRELHGITTGRAVAAWLLATTTIVLLMATAVAGATCLQKELATKELTLSELIFCSEEPYSKTNCKEQPNATYEVGETIWMGLWVDGLEVEEQGDGDTEVNVTLAIKVIDTNGDTVDEWPSWWGRGSGTETKVADNIWLTPKIDFRFHCTEGLSPGKYTVSIDVTDDVAGETKNVEGEFYVA